MTFVDVLRSIWADAVDTQPAPGSVLVWLAPLAALAAVVVPQVWSRSRLVVTIAQEGGHGVAALLTGRRLAGIRLHSDASGLTVSRGLSAGPGMVVTALAGYLSPALIGLGAAYLLQRGHALAVLWLAVLLLGLLLLQIRNFYGLYAVLVAGSAVLAVSWWGSDHTQSAAAHTGTWFLLLAAPRPVLELQGQRRRGRARGSDADLLARLTHLPGIVWVIFFLAATVGCLLLGAGWLLATTLTA